MFVQLKSHESLVCACTTNYSWNDEANGSQREREWNNVIFSSSFFGGFILIIDAAAVAAAAAWPTRYGS